MILRFRRYRFVLRLVIGSLPLPAFLIAGYLCFVVFGSKHSFERDTYLHLVLFTTVIWSIVAEQKELTRIVKIRAERTGARAALSACSQTYIAVFVVLFFCREVYFSRLFFVLSAAVLMILTLVVRALFRSALWTLRDRGTEVKLLVVGTGRFARRAAARIQRDTFIRCRVSGYVQLPGDEVQVSRAPVYRLDELNKIEMLNVDDIVIAIPADRYSEIRSCVAQLEVLCKPIRVILDIAGGIVARDRLVQFGRLQMLDLDPSPVASVKYSLGKRAFDVAFSTLALVLVSPVMLAIAIGIKLTSHGPVLFRQERVGLSGELFSMYKFRTMHVASQNESDTRWTTSADPRRTRLGSLLRKTSLDELPQFFNVLKGDMSVVGPRPERPFFVKQFRQSIARYHNRHRLKVGITGWAQVNGLRGDTSIRRRLLYDLYYLENWSFTLDMRIIWMTFWGGLTGKGAY